MSQGAPHPVVRVAVHLLVVARKANHCHAHRGKAFIEKGSETERIHRIAFFSLVKSHGILF